MAVKYKGVMLSFTGDRLTRLDAYCKRTGASRSGAVMLAIDGMLDRMGNPAVVTPPVSDYHAQPLKTSKAKAAEPGTEGLVKKALGAKKKR